MYYKCCVPGCNSIRQDVKLHKFPASELRRTKWLKCIYRDDLRALSLTDIAKLQVCHKHFETRFLTNKSNLRSYAIPTLFSTLEISSGIPSGLYEDTENISPNLTHGSVKKWLHDHTYCKLNISPCEEIQSSQSTAHYVDGSPVSGTLKNTAEVVKFLDNLFDSVNGASLSNNKKSRGKELRRAVTSDSKHHEFWREALNNLNMFKFVDKNGRTTTVPSIKNCKVTLHSYMKLWQFFSAKNFKIMRPRYFNSDAIENYFGQIRSYNFRNNNPDCHSFINTFKSLLITGFIKFHHDSFNCEDDSSRQLININSLFSHIDNKNEVPYKDDEASVSHFHHLCEEESSFSKSLQEARKEKINIHSRAYTVGWVIRKIFLIRKFNCKTCKNDLTVQQDAPIHKWINYKEFKSLRDRKLTYPTEQAVMYFGKILTETNSFLEENAFKQNISTNIENAILNKHEFNFITCQNHKHLITKAFLQISIKLAIFNWCKIINNVLRGTDIVRLEKSNNISLMQRKALNKYKKKLKKNINK